MTLSHHFYFQYIDINKLDILAYFKGLVVTVDFNAGAAACACADDTS